MMSRYNHAFLKLTLLLEIAALVCQPVHRSNAVEPRSKPTTEQLVTGDQERLGNVVTDTGPTLKFYFTPRPPLPGTDPSLAYPSGYMIAGQKLTVSGGGFTSAWIGQIEGWDPDGNGDVLLREFQERIDAAGFLGANAAPPNPGCNLVYPADSSFPCQKSCAGGVNNGQPCSSNSNCPGGACQDPCSSILGESGPFCSNDGFGVCDWGWQDLYRTDWIAASVPPDQQFPGKNLVSPFGPLFACAVGPAFPISDGGLRYYSATLVLPVPACCKGMYMMGHVAAETIAHDQAVSLNEIPIADLVAGQLECQVGSCCTAAACVDGVTNAECTLFSGIFAPGGHCLNPPTTDGCCECAGGPGPAGNAECEALENPSDRCITSTCVNCQCHRAPKPGWSPAIQCCDANTGMVTTKATPDGPCVRGCSLPNSYGVPQIVFTPAGTACDTGAQCIDNEQCNGQGQCSGTPTPAGTPCTLADGPDPCVASVACDGQNHCVGEEYLGPECLKNRYVSIYPQDVGGFSALRVTLDSLQHPSPPNLPQYPSQDFSAFEGQARWVGPPQDCEESELLLTSFKCAFLQCTPFYADWTTLLDGNWLQITGPEIMPSSSYTVDQLNASCQGNEDACTDIAMTRQLATARYGDCAPPYQDPSPNAALTQPNIADLAAVVSKFVDVANAMSRSRTQLQPNAIAAGQYITIADVAGAVDAFRSRSYTQAGPQQCP